MTMWQDQTLMKVMTAELLLLLLMRKTFWWAENVYDDNDDICDESSSLIQTKKLIVFEHCFDDFRNCFICSISKCPVDPSDTIKEFYDSMFKVSVFCTGDHLVKKLLSQPMLGKLPKLTCFYVQQLFADQTYGYIFQIPIFLNVQFVSKTTFQFVQREL